MNALLLKTNWLDKIVHVQLMNASLKTQNQLFSKSTKTSFINYSIQIYCKYVILKF